MIIEFIRVGVVISAKISFGQWLKQRRKALDLTREDLAGRIGCAAVTLYKIESDERRPSKQIAALLAQHLNISLDEQAAFVQFARAEAVDAVAPWGTPFHSPTNLPAQPTLLIGRDEDVAAIQKRLVRPESRLLTLVGPPGIGKTRLALQVASQVLDDFPDGVFFIALAAISDANLVSTTIATTLGIPDAGPQTPLERLKTFLRDKQMLLVLDNFEQILTAAAQISELLATCLSVKMLVTSRAPLRIRQERQIPVSPLAVPDLAHLPDIENVMHYSAVTLFLERAQAVKPDFSLNLENALTVAAICSRLDGLPLAIELISARVKLLSPGALLERLGGRLMLQSDGLRDIEPRHRTLNAAIDWSYQLLSVDEQTQFRRLGVFVGGWTLEAAEAVCTENLKLNILDGLASLLDKNLVKHDTRSNSEPRFMMLETIREYALEKLAESGELDNLRKRHADYFTVFAEHTQTGHVQWLNNLEAEHDNLRAALAWSGTGLRLAVTLGSFWQQRGHLREGSAWLRDAMTRQGTGILAAKDRTLRARALDWLGVFSQLQGNLDNAQLLHEESLALFQELEDPAGIIEAMADYGILFVQQGDHERASTLLNESLTLSRELGQTGSIAASLLFLGCLAYSQGLITRAVTLWEESLVLCRADDNTWVIATLLAYLATAALERSEYHQAHIQLAESLTLLWELGERWQIVHTLEVFACLGSVQRQQTEGAQPSLLHAAHIFGMAEVLRETISAPVLRFQQDFKERGVAALRTQLDEASFAVAWAEGRAMTLEQAVAYALDQSENESGGSH
ncbi:MAG: tetratricopeptide repeat protein [Chloroflexota bacterium]